MNKDIEFTEKDLYCIARHIQVYVLRNENEVPKKEDNPCCRCEYKFKCYENNVCVYHCSVFQKLSKITGLKMGFGVKL